ncbi:MULTISPECIES: hypothetical protein [Chromohalobacter]|uniref:Preprotein translocase subunit YajC n=1 Tax=Chromohalobacter israelensis (strain ATCC BAA-138 / DSM 3043 / CIP 106854 / NCIMB 13768 / 1H11) TaxID=290398 RepID=Q1QUW5_CHRI1|nr:MULTISPECIES: hypothetical protein [Chromohalobacter]ABE59743.1 hypothetical protein Csal_2396 [Chromohalobacter salexigens DSM 3043]MDF9435846.1 preprotein translocase subunit YajC [Chromohalobacter israelensis]MDO0947134.1 preprotein translocase subunit YajC [Chromohalobacter salexigens]NQY47004.1 preprotein translocase subunit YajC [Chromohalobacter sp.]PWW31685.1 hypothetical protein DFO74_13710 [Chromohalobacter salexigens]
MEIFLFLGLAVFAILSPALWLRPSRHETRRSGLRQAAREAGAALRFDKAPLQEARDMVGYRWRYPQAAPGSDFTLVREAHASDRLEEAMSGWRWRQAPLPPLNAAALQRLEAVLAVLPEDACVVESTSKGVTLWWEESQDAESFAPALRALTGLVDDLAGSGRHAG